MSFLLHQLQWGLKGQHFESVASIILRIPGLALLDHWWQHSITYTWPHSQDAADIFGAIIANLVLLQGILILLLSLDRLVFLYMHYISIGLISVACILSRYYVATELELADVKSQSSASVDEDKRLLHFTVSEVLSPDSAYRIAKGYRHLALGNDDVSSFSAGRYNSMVYGIFHGGTSEDEFYFLRRQVAAIAIQVMIASVIAFCLDVSCHYKRAFLAVYTLPVVVRFSGLPISLLLYIHNVSSALVILITIFYVLAYIPDLLSFTKAVYFRLFFEAKMFGISHILIELFYQLCIPVHFLGFWLVQFVSELYEYLVFSEPNNGFIMDRWYMAGLWCLTQVCCTPIAFVSTTVVVAYISSATQRTVQLFIQGSRGIPDDRYPKAGVTEGLTFFLLGVQTGFMNIKMPYRLAAITVILFVVSASLIQSIFEVIEPVLLATGAQKTTSSIIKQIKILALCVILFVSPLFMTNALAKIFDLDFWTLVVMTSCVMTSVQVIGLLVIHGIFMYDAYKTEPWESLDDIVYYTRASVRFLEFVIAVFIVGAGFHESLVGSWSWSNSAILLIHCYFNVWQRLQVGWKSFLQRREAVQKINALAYATAVELDILKDDVCSICYEEMRKSVRRTPCKHYFHGACLRKWLYIQEKCPICSASITHPKTKEVPQESTPSPDANMPSIDEIRRSLLNSPPEVLPRLPDRARMERLRHGRSRSESIYT